MVAEEAEKHYAEAEVQNEDEVIGNVKIVHPDNFHKTEEDLNSIVEVCFLHSFKRTPVIIIKIMKKKKNLTQ